MIATDGQQYRRQSVTDVAINNILDKEYSKQDTYQRKKEDNELKIEE